MPNVTDLSGNARQDHSDAAPRTQEDGRSGNQKLASAGEDAQDPRAAGSRWGRHGNGTDSPSDAAGPLRALTGQTESRISRKELCPVLSGILSEKRRSRFPVIQKRKCS